VTDWAAVYQELVSIDTADSADTKVGGQIIIIPQVARAPVCVSRVSCVNKAPTAKDDRVASLATALSDLERDCPDRVGARDWQYAFEDARYFLAQWGSEAERLGWTANDLFGLPPIPEKPAPNYRRLARFDQVGLVWLLHGRKVVALSADRAVIATPSEASIRSASYPQSIQRGTITFYWPGRVGHG
jgi:hypothetical protein